MTTTRALLESLNDTKRRRTEAEAAGDMATIPDATVEIDALLGEMQERADGHLRRYATRPLRRRAKRGEGVGA